jgi:hypothetical protein
MAIVGITPTFMSPIAYRDSAAELAQQSREGAQALQNAFKFGTQVYDAVKNRQIGDALAKGDTNKAALLESRKINNADPTSFWKWKTEGDRAAAAAAAQKESDLTNTQNSLRNATTALLNNVVTNNPEAQAMYINNLNTQKAKLLDSGMTKEAELVDQKIAEMTGAMQGGLEQRQADAAKAEEAKQIKETYSKTTGDIDKQISAGATDSAWKMAQEAWKAGIIDDKDLERFKEQIKAKNEATNWERHGKSQQLKNEKKQAQKDADDDWASKLF